MAKHVNLGKRVRVPRGMRHRHGGGHRRSRLGALTVDMLTRVRSTRRYGVELVFARVALWIALRLTSPRLGG